MYRKILKLLLLVIIIPYFIGGCVDPGPKLLYYGDGKHESMRALTDTGHAIQFTVPAGNWGIKSIRFFAIRQGSSAGQLGQIKLAICDESLQPIYEGTAAQGMVDTVSEKWRNIDVSPPLYHPGEIWVILDTNSGQSERIKVGVDSSIKISHSKMGVVGGPLSELPETFDWMIRVELVELSPEEMEKLEGGE